MALKCRKLPCRMHSKFDFCFQLKYKWTVEGIYLATRDLYPTKPSSSVIPPAIATGLLRQSTVHKTLVKICHLWAEPSCPYKLARWTNAQPLWIIIKSLPKIAWWSATIVKMRSLGSMVPPTRSAISACQATQASSLELRRRMFSQRPTLRTLPRVLPKRFLGE